MWNPDFEPRIGYFSMEIGLESSIPTYSGGLGVLAAPALNGSSVTTERMMREYRTNAYRL